MMQNKQGQKKLISSLAAAFTHGYWVFKLKNQYALRMKLNFRRMSSFHRRCSFPFGCVCFCLADALYEYRGLINNVSKAARRIASEMISRTIIIIIRPLSFLIMDFSLVTTIKLEMQLYVRKRERARVSRPPLLALLSHSNDAGYQQWN
jgi:hypothetical protein